MWLVDELALAQDSGANFREMSDVAFPACDSLINIKLPPYNAKVDWISDDSQAVQRAIDGLSTHKYGGIERWGEPSCCPLHARLNQRQLNRRD